jgi:DNA-binding MurR/RpiR family transcriptional regulator
MRLDARLKAEFETLSPQMKEAARWVIDHPADVALLSTREQARRAGVAPATLTRLAQRLGLSGYDGLRKVYAEAVRQRPESYRGRAAELLARTAREGDAALVQDIFAALTHHLVNLSTPGVIRAFAAAADRIATAEQVFCVGLRSCFSVAFIFHYIRTLFGANSVLLDGPGATSADALRTIGPSDVFLAVSVQPYARLAIDMATYAKGRGASLVALTDSEVSPLAALADVAIPVRTETPSFFHTMTPAFAAAECLAAMVAARRGTDALTALEASEAQLAAFGTYLPPYPKGSRRP